MREGIELPTEEPYSTEAHSTEALEPISIKEYLASAVQQDSGDIRIDIPINKEPPSILFEFDPSWIDATKPVTISFGGYSISMSKEILESISHALTIELRDKELTISTNGETEFGSYTQPIVIGMPGGFADEYTVICEKTGQNIIPRCWAVNGTIYAKISGYGTYYPMQMQPQGFEDTEGLWMNPAIKYLSARQLISGTAPSRFEPEDELTRAQCVAILLRAFPANTDTAQIEPFNDIDKNSYYYNAILQAYALNYVSGQGHGFNPDKPITRQDMFTIIYRAMESLGIISEPENYQALEVYKDSGQISGYAQAAITALIENKIILGYEDSLRPLDIITRGEAAQIFANILKLDMISELY